MGNTSDRLEDPHPPGYSLRGRVALVTGSSGSIGQAICRELATRGASIVAAYGSNHAAMGTLVAAIGDEGGRCETVAVDLTVESAPADLVADIVKRHGRLDVVVPCAGITVRKPALMTPFAQAEELYRLNVRSVIELGRISIRMMMRHKWGRVIPIGSRAGTHGLPGQAVYASSKAAIEGWVKSVAFEVGGGGVTANIVAPGAVAEEGKTVYSPQEAETVKTRIGLARLGEPREIASVVGFLASPAASYVNGSTVTVDGAARF